jgi:hypothetical protein
MIPHGRVAALPLWQPWASLIAVGAKSIETRSWRCYPWLVGERIAIHATKTRSELGFVRTEPFHRRLREARVAGDLLLVDGELPLGALIATVRVEGCYEITTENGFELFADDPDEHAFGDYTPGRFAWRLGDLRRLPELVPWTGSQKIFSVPAGVVGCEVAQETLL